MSAGGWRAGTTQHRLCLFPMPSLPALAPHLRHEGGVYLSGALFAAAWWLFIDGAIQATQRGIGMSAEWTPGVCVMLGMFIVNSIDQSRLTGDGYLLDPISAWRARLALFLGVTVMVSGVAGSVAMLCVKFTSIYAYPGYCIVAQCCLLIIR
ncbi:hypothetical protein BDF22DRAFT_124633 [Syncephalis plumigaleata]|nr:hypothetical protein BDF22DRAFT_124633 [Syncephalis plumigaleata]